MLYSLFNFWNIFWITTLVFFIYFYLYVKYIGNFKEIFLKISYSLIVWITLFSYFFIEIDFIFKFFFTKVNDIVIIKDVQDLVNLSIDLALIFSIFFTIPLILIYIIMYLLNFWNILSFKAWKPFFILFIYYYILFKYLLDTDLFLSGWEFFNKNNLYNYDFQPDFLFLIISYIGDFYDLSLFFISIFTLFIFLNHFLSYKIWNIYNKKSFFILKITIQIFLGIFFFYFFGGENFFRDTLLIIVSIFCLELYFFSWLFFFNIKRKKI